MLPETEPEECGVGCCGGGTCDASVGEDYWTCRTDCSSPRTVKINLLRPTREKEFLGGDTVQLQVTVDADSRNQVLVDRLTADGSFGILELFDDGEHDDNETGDGLYGNSFVVKDENTTSFKAMRLTARINQKTQRLKAGYQVIPVLSLNVASNKKNFSQGDRIELKGLLKRKKEPLQGTVHIILSSAGQTILDQNVNSDEKGAFSLAYQTTLIDPAGNWRVFAETRDNAGNYGFIRRDINVFEPMPFVQLKIDFLTDTENFFVRGQTQPFMLRVLDSYNELVTDANVEWITPLNELFRFAETPEHRYSLAYPIPISLPKGKQAFEIRAFHPTAYSTMQGNRTIMLNISEAPLSINVLEPTILAAQVGESIPFKIRVSYPNGEPIEQATLNAMVNGHAVVLQAIEKGVFAGEYVVQPTDQGRPVFSLEVSDSFENTGSEQLEFVVSGVSLLQFVREHKWELAILVGILTVALLTIYHLNFGQRIQQKQDARIQKIEAQIAQNQRNYFRDTTISRETFEKLQTQYTQELARIRGEEKKKEKKAP